MGYGQLNCEDAARSELVKDKGGPRNEIVGI